MKKPRKYNIWDQNDIQSRTRHSENMTLFLCDQTYHIKEGGQYLGLQQPLIQLGSYVERLAQYKRLQ